MAMRRRRRSERRTDFPPNRDEAQRDCANEAAPEHEAAATPQISNVVREDRDIVELCTDHRPNQRGKQHVADGGGLDVMPAARQLAFRHDLRDEKGHQHRDAKAGQIEAGRSRIETGDG